MSMFPVPKAACTVRSVGRKFESASSLEMPVSEIDRTLILPVMDGSASNIASVYEERASKDTL